MVAPGYREFLLDRDNQPSGRQLHDLVVMRCVEGHEQLFAPGPGTVRRTPVVGHFEDGTCVANVVVIGEQQVPLR